MKKITYLIFGHFFLVLGVIGAFLPVLPTTPFLLLAAFCYSRSNSRLHHWLRSHKVFGPPLKDWQDNGVIGIKAKIIASLMIGYVLFFRFPTLNVHFVIKLLASLTLGGVLIFLWTRPSKRIKEPRNLKDEGP